MTHNLVGLLAGTHVVQVVFNGSSTQAPCTGEIEVEVVPVVVVTINNDESLFVDQKNTLSISVSVLGTKSDWVGSLSTLLLNPSGDVISSRAFEIDSYSVLDIDFNPVIVGVYSLNITVTGLPVSVEHTYPLSIAVNRESLHIELDAGNTSLLGGFSIIVVIGIVMRKKMRGIICTMAEEWTG